MSKAGDEAQGSHVEKVGDQTVKMRINAKEAFVLEFSIETLSKSVPDVYRPVFSTIVDKVKKAHKDLPPPK